MAQLEELLTAWLPRQRWFAGKGAPIDALTVKAAHVLTRGTPGLHVLVVAVSQRGTTDLYHLLLGLRREGPLSDELAHAHIGVCELTPEEGGAPVSHTVYEATYDPDLMGVLLDHLAAGSTVGPLRFHRSTRRPITTGLRSLVIKGEQSNTSLIFGEEYVLKIFRRLWPGQNPDLELTSALADSPHVAQPFGWIETDVWERANDASHPTTLAMLQEYLISATDGWALAATSVRDLYASPELDPGEAGGDFAGEAERLGAATAAVHRDLARKLPTDTLTPERIVDLAAEMVDRLHAAATEVTELERYVEPLREVFDELAELGSPLPVQRVHGDYHLGQVVRTDTGWVLLDFEGEPAASVARRQRLSSPLRDVAGMLRSFDYAARHQLIGHAYEAELSVPARAWAQRNRDAFCAGYAAGGGVDPYQHEIVLRAFEYDKAVYEVMYEARHRPSWLRIPLDSIAALVERHRERTATSKRSRR